MRVYICIDTGVLTCIISIYLYIYIYINRDKHMIPSVLVPYHISGPQRFGPLQLRCVLAGLRQLRRGRRAETEDPDLTEAQDPRVQSMSIHVKWARERE